MIRTLYRYQIQGPNAKQIIEKLNGGPFPEIKFFNMGEIKIKGKHGARAASRHGGRSRTRDLGTVRGEATKFAD